jgi:hypothetical protein
LLIYIVSLAFQSAIDVTINNQCSNIELTSTVYFIKDEMCHIQFPQQVNAKSIMKAKFMTSIGQDTFGGALSYRLLRKVGTSICTRLLVFWGCKYNSTYLSAFLIKHENTLVWDEDKLRRFYDVYNQSRDAGLFQNFYIAPTTWSLDDNTTLYIVCNQAHGGFGIEVIISEKEHIPNFVRPIWITSSIFKREKL